MDRKRLTLWIIGLAAVLILIVIADHAQLFCIRTVWAESSDGTGMNWQVLSAGGAPAASTSGHVSMNSTLGQTAIGPSSAGQTTLWAGFWHSIKQVLMNTFIPIIMR
jgi:hypothetical protein